MADFCTCGAQLPVDARFCHRCGRPLFAEPPPEVDAPVELEAPSAGDLRAVTATTEAPLPITFSNSNAVRAGLLTAVIIWVLVLIPIGGVAELFLKLFVLLGGGFMAVLFYSRRTGQMLSVFAGARLGWITGVFFYVIWILFFTINILITQQQGALTDVINKQLKESKAPAETVRQMTEIMQSPEAFGTMILLMLAMVFVAATIPMILGGAVAAKALERD